MFEGVAAFLLNKYLGKYIDDLDSEKLNIGIFSGTVQLTELKFKPEALYELDLPIEVKVGSVGKISIDIPWMTLYSDPVLVHIEDIFILCGPVTDREYDPEREKRLLRAQKKKRLEEVQDFSSIEELESKPRGFFENLAATLINNIQVSIQNVHIRYEDIVSGHSALACGMLIQSLTAITTNNKWKPTQIDGDAKSIFKLVKLESLSIYVNPVCHPENLVLRDMHSSFWKNSMKKALATFSMNGDEFEFVMKPVSAKVKMIFNKSSEAKVPKLLLDFLLQDAASQLSREQYISILNLSKSFERMEINRRFAKYHCNVPVHGHAKEWWHYAYTAIVEEYIRPYSWQRIKEHRKRYRRYKEMYKQKLLYPTNTEIRLDVQLLEDHMDIANILMAREETKLEFIKEQPEKTIIRKRDKSWWESWFGLDSEEEENELEVLGEREKSLWSRLTQEEKQKLYEAIGYFDDETLETLKQYIAHKLNFTLANCTFSLINFDKEILVITLTQFVTSIETRPSNKAFKISARTESFVVEGASIENDLVPIMTADNITSGSNLAHVFALDFEKNPLHEKADYGLTINAEPMEIVYHEHALKELIAFFYIPTITFEDFKKVTTEKLQSLAVITRDGLEYAFTNHKTAFHLSIDLKSPYFVIPEHGSLQKAGTILVLDMGRLIINSDIQPESTLLEEATKMEIEERLYDRFNIVLSDFQILFADSGDEWRNAKQLPESDIHLLPKARIQTLFSNSIKAEYKQLPRQKLNVSLPSFKLNLSDRRIQLLMEFASNLPIIKLQQIGSLCSFDVVDTITDTNIDIQQCKLELKACELKKIKSLITSDASSKIVKDSKSSTENSITGSVERYYSSSDHSDEEPEEWARKVDLPGFDDNISPSNSINILLRFLIGEVVVHLARSSDHIDKPYLMLRTEKLCVDVALMEFGPALQASLGRIQLVDKLHTGSSGEYLELISSKHTSDMITILYRKVLANCPEFKSHFHQVEHSLVIDITTLYINFHREAFVTLGKFLQYVLTKIMPKDSALKTLLPEIPSPNILMLNEENDPPVPSGATKFSISARVDTIQIKLCDTDMELADLKIAGFECDYVLKANERIILRIDLTDLSVEDLMESTLYSKILSIEDDKVFDFKYVKHSPHHNEVGNDETVSPLVANGTLRIRIGRIQVVFLYRFLAEVQRFFEPFIQPEFTLMAKKSAENALQEQVLEYKKSGLRLQLSIDIHAPTVLLPQKSSSPNLLLLNLGDLSIENFFKEVQIANNQYFIDNILFRLNSLQMSRAIILLDGNMENQEAILEPMKLRLDIKRSLPPYHRDILFYDIRGSMDVIKMSIGQRDLSTLIAVYNENFSEGDLPETYKILSSPTSPMESHTPTVNEDSVKKLEAFLSISNEVYKETSVTFVLEGMSLTLYTDIEEMFSSPIRDPIHALSKFELDEVNISVEMYSDKALELKCTLQAATLEDVRSESPLCVKKIFQSYSGDSQSGVAGISISMPPMIDLTYRHTGNGDAAVDVHVEKTRLNVSVPYILAIFKYIYDALPDQYGKEIKSDELDPPNIAVHQGKVLAIGHRRLPSDSTSGYHSTASSQEDTRSLSVSIILRKPEIVLFANPLDINSQVLVLKTDIMVDYSKNMGQDNIMATVAGLHILSCTYSKRKQTLCTVLYPCEVEFSRSQRLSEDEIKMTASLSCVDLHLSTHIIYTIRNVVEELLSNIQNKDSKEKMTSKHEYKELQDLWSPKVITPNKWMVYTGNESEIIRPSYPSTKSQEILTISVPNLQIMFEEINGKRKVPKLYFKTSLYSEIHNWSKQPYMKTELQLEFLYFNQNIAVWEPIIEPVMESENYYRPWEVLIKVFQDHSNPIFCSQTDRDAILLSDIVDSDTRSLTSRVVSDSSSGDNDDTDEEMGMTVIRHHPVARPKRLGSVKSHDSGSLVAYPPDSDSENEDGILEKIASTFGHLFSDESSEELSDSDNLNDTDVKSDSGETETADNEGSIEEHPVFISSGKNKGRMYVLLSPSEDAVDSILNQRVETLATYVVIDSKDQFDINFTPTGMKVIQEIIETFNKMPPENENMILQDIDKDIILKNYLGPEAKVSIMKKSENDEEYKITEETFGIGANSSPNTPATACPLVDISPTDSEIDVIGDENDNFTLSTSAFQNDSNKLLYNTINYGEKDISELYKETIKEKISIQIKGFDKLQCLMPQRTGSIMYALQPTKNKTRYYIVIDMSANHGQKIITVSSPLQIQNHLPRPVHIMCQKSILEAVGAMPDDYSKNPFHETYIRLTTLENNEIYNVPLLIAYHCKLFLQPASTSLDINNHDVSNEGLWWQDVTVSQKNIKFLICNNKEFNNVFCIKVVCTENKNARSPATGSKLVPNYTLHLYSPVNIHNSLPYVLNLTFKNDKQVKLGQGESVPVLDIEPHKLQEVKFEVSQYFGIPWTGSLELTANMEEHRTIVMEPESDTEGGNKQLSLSVHLQDEYSLDVYLFAPYWIVNKTNLPLQFRGSSSDVLYETYATSDEPLLFRFKKHKKKKAKVRVYNSRWSQAISFDTIGNNGVLVCVDKERNKKYTFFLEIRLSQLQLTKIIIIFPYFIVINKTKRHLRYMEENEQADLWFDIAPNQCLPFWPDTDSMKMLVKNRDSKIVSQHFPISTNHKTVLRMDHGSALCVEVTGGTDTHSSITFYPYCVGDVPVRVENLCEDLFFKIHQKSQSQVTLLSPYQSVLYTWDDPSLEQTLIWNLYNRKKPGFPAQIARDGHGSETLTVHSLKQNANIQKCKSPAETSSTDDDDSESEETALLPQKTRKDKVIVYWVSYLDDHQRVLLFTQDERVSKQVAKAIDGENANFECFLSLNGISLSLINGAYKEIAYLGIKGAPAMWEIEINHTWKLLTLELSTWLEDKWRGEKQKAELKDYLQVDFIKMHMTKPCFGQLRRTYTPSLWCHFRKSTHQSYVYAKIHRFQIDNQLPDAIFPTVLYPVPPPQALVRRNGPKPFIEMALLTHKSRNLNLNTIKYFKVLIQELNIRIDKGFLLSVYDIFSSLQVPKEEKEKLKMDLLLVQQPLWKTKQVKISRSKRTVVEYIHLSPLKIHFSFSPRGIVHKAKPDPWSLQQDVVDFFFNSIGATLTEVKDVELRMAFYEKRGKVFTPVELLMDVKSHYINQIIQQAYVLILGLDILGNPFGLIKDFTQGLGDFFYEPFLGSIQGPEEFTEGIVKGVQSLLGHVIGGTAGSISLITGSLGQIFSFFSMDEDYRKKRRLRMQQHPSSLPETLLIAGKGFVLGVALGLSGVIVKPIVGAQQEGVEGFFKGIGKGIMGLITKPAGGVIDMVSMAFDGIKRAAEMGEDIIVRQRLPRFINPTLGLKPYSPYQATGYRLLFFLSKGHYAESDIYWAHAPLSKEERCDIALVTDKHVFLLEKCRFWGGWDIEWVVRVDDIMSVPILSGKKLVIKIRQDDSFAVFTGNERYIQSCDIKVLEWLKMKIEKVLLVNMEDKPCATDV
ncbi:intermembrane lipid transfer protein VPS13A-like isoform X2 [Centruroides vittatus]|uniref:intermembrane lipid transfer protein VPS13A-like isoform X2 n=1 Tax=Centruroides vittatus TaxID=120091 RepID=UPI00350F0C25